MKKMKKFLAMLLAAVMVMGMSVTVFATENKTPVSGTPNSGNEVEVKITEVTGNPTVKLYQIARARYETNGANGFIGYEWAEGIVLDSDETNEHKGTYSSNQIADIANKLVKEGKTIFGTEPSKEEVLPVDMTVSGTAATRTVKAGAYIAILTGAEDGSIYNPILLTATYRVDGEKDVNLIGGVISATSEYDLLGDTSVAKKTTPSVDKKMNENDIEKDGMNKTELPNEGGVINTTTTPSPISNATASVGDVIGYTITPTIPSYPENAKNKTLAVTDRTSAGLTLDFSTLIIKLDDGEYKPALKSGSQDIYVFSKDSKAFAYAKEAKEDDKTVGFDITFVYDELIKDKATGVLYGLTIEYKAVINGDAVVGSDGNTNTTTLYYTNKPNTESDFDPENVEIPDPTMGDDIKTKTDKETVYTYQLAFKKVGVGEKDEKGLEGAVFGIYSSQDCTEESLIDVVTTDANGFAASSQVKAGTYYIKEISAPTGYTLNEKVYEVTANWSTATTTITGSTVTKRTYTSNIDETESKVQVGWLDAAGKFYAMDEFKQEEEGKIFKAYLLKETAITTNEGSVIETVQNVTGTVSALKELGGTNVIESIPNTKLSSLPSTGGIGTTIFTIGGCAIMVIAAGLFFATRRKSER